MIEQEHVPDQKSVWGIASAIDIYDCHPETTRAPKATRRFVAELCDLIEMERLGETQVVHFGGDEKEADCSMAQRIETARISKHFANLTNAVYLDLFSCKSCPPETVKHVAQDFWAAVKTA
ncbi:hypothetical protein DSLASN_44870 [Desulfoluna limicola]|uniref:Beta-N-acetylhexosaminidase n=1 Tax=Desulfoluna limicola TaxID=2810562 RepID=A0ABM7PP74_9BACT|nr:S-adenosylmethionine decarboxylase [Desulfoluna limicola]BCS98855.1 hypothetical protein DSLASN_44870 [Desulfoluna limicola]